MKRAATTCLILWILLSGCAVKPAAAPPQIEKKIGPSTPSQTDDPASPDIKKPAAPETPTAGQTVNLAAAVPEIIRSVLKGGEELPTAAQREELAQKIADLGFPVLRLDENMLHYEPVAEFCAKAAAGQDDAVTVFLYPWNYLISVTFTSQNGNITCAYTNYTEEKAEAEKAQKVDEFTFTEKGNLIYHIESNPDKSGFRVLPLSEESRTYYKKYVVPANTFAAGPLDASWNNEDFSGLNWEWIFERLWEIKTGRDMLDPASKYYKKAPDNNHFDSVVLPAEIVEGMLQKYFNVSTEDLRQMEQFAAKTAAYTFSGFRGGGYSATLEVAKSQSNADGSLTLWIDHVALEFGKELSAQSILTVMPQKDGGFKYLSNVFVVY